MSCSPEACQCCCSLCSWWNNQSVLCQGWPKLSRTMLKQVFQLGLKPRGVCCSSKTSLRNRLFRLRQHILTFQARHDTEKYLQQSCASATDEHQPWVLRSPMQPLPHHVWRSYSAALGAIWKEGESEKAKIKTDNTVTDPSNQTAEQQWALGVSAGFLQAFRILSREAASDLNRVFFLALCKQDFPEECSLYIECRPGTVPAFPPWNKFEETIQPPSLTLSSFFACSRAALRFIWYMACWRSNQHYCSYCKQSHHFSL